MINYYNGEHINDKNQLRDFEIFKTDDLHYECVGYSCNAVFDCFTFYINKIIGMFSCSNEYSAFPSLILMTHGKPISTALRTEFTIKSKYIIKNIKENSEKYNKEEIVHNVDIGMSLGSFLSEAGWIEDSLNVLINVLPLIELLVIDYATLILKLDCIQRLLYAQATLCYFKEAAVTVKNALNVIYQISIDKVPNSLLANLYIQISFLHFLRNEYDLSYNWSIKALKKVGKNTPDKTAIDVLRQAAKSCVVKRYFKRANMLITQACRRARAVFGGSHQKYADALLDYGFYLLTVDSITDSVDAYNDVLIMRQNIFGSKNFHVAIAHEGLAYALYVHEYSSGRFMSASEHIEQAISIMKHLVPSHHLILASAKSVKALILEEIALDNIPRPNSELLEKSEELHRSAIQSSLETFGERNVQTAKHYGNLGRLYQIMMRFDDAEKMHQCAIKIKTDLLGPYDHEVGLSIGHLALLYNYHMKKHRKAEELYLRSVTISLRLFGSRYSGLEYDYRGLCHIYEALDETEKFIEYSRILEEWKILKEENNTAHNRIYIELKDDAPMEEVTSKFFEMCSENEAINVS